MLEIKTNEILINVFDDMTSIYKYLKTTPRRKTAKKDSEQNGYSFTKTKSFNEAVDLMRYGDDELYKKILKDKKSLDIQRIIGNELKKAKQHNDVVGFQPNVPAYLTNNPMTMININQNKTSQRIINILLSADVSAYVDTDDVEKAGSVYLNAIDILERLGYRCNLYLGYCVNNRNHNNCNRMYMITKIKTDKEPLNIKKTAFPLAHASMFRRIGFGWIERCNCYGDTDECDDITNNGYGSPYRDTETITKELKKYLKKDFSIWSYQNADGVSIEGAIDSLKDCGIDLNLEF